jgi:hypothetical protein
VLTDAPPHTHTHTHTHTPRTQYYGRGADDQYADGEIEEAYEAALRPFWAAMKHEVSACGSDLAEYKNQQLPLARIKKVAAPAVWAFGRAWVGWGVHRRDARTAAPDTRSHARTHVRMHTHPSAHALTPLHCHQRTPHYRRS